VGCRPKSTRQITLKHEEGLRPQVIDKIAIKWRGLSAQVFILTSSKYSFTENFTEILNSESSVE